MSLEVWISMAAALISAVAAAVAGWQAREARRQAKAAEDQVLEARRSATAAEEQVEIMRRQYEAHQAERDDRAAERRKRETEQAKLVTIAVDYSTNSVGAMGVVITNDSEQYVGWPRVESMRAIGPSRHPCWGERLPLFDEDGEEYRIGPDPVLRKGKPIRVPFRHFNADYQPVDLVAAFLAETINEYTPRVDDVTITFDMFGVRWRRIGNADPVPDGSASSQARETVST